MKNMTIKNIFEGKESKLYEAVCKLVILLILVGAVGGLWVLLDDTLEDALKQWQHSLSR